MWFGLVWFRYRRKREKLVELIAVSRLPTKWGLFRAYCYQSRLDGTEHIAVVKVMRSHVPATYPSSSSSRDRKKKCKSYRQCLRCRAISATAKRSW